MKKNFVLVLSCFLFINAWSAGDDHVAPEGDTVVGYLLDSRLPQAARFMSSMGCSTSAADQQEMDDLFDRLEDQELTGRNGSNVPALLFSSLMVMIVGLIINTHP